MDHRDVLKGLAPETRAALTQKSDAAGLSHLAVHSGAIAFFGSAIALQVPFWGVLVPIQGVLLVFLFTLQHETTHDTPFASEALCRRVGQICGFLLVLPPTWFRYFHLAHHRFTQIPGKDPELAEPKPRTLRDYVWHLSGIPLWRSLCSTLWRNAAGRCEDGFVPESRRSEITSEARWMLAGYAGLAAVSAWIASPILLWVWLVPMVVAQPVLRLYLLAEHGRCAFVSNMLENTRTTFTNALVRRLAWNMPYHTEHHSYPAVPFHKLPDLHRIMAPHLQVTDQGYNRFHRGYVNHITRSRPDGERTT